MANKAINSIQFNSGDINVITLPYGECSTKASTAAKTVTVENFALETGAQIKVKFINTNSASSPTLNINGTGAKNIMYRGSAISAGGLASNRIYEFVYDGTNWELVGDLNTDTNTTYTAGAGIGLSGTTFSNAGVRSITTGSTNGTINVNTNGSSANVAVKGLGAAAYKGVDTSLTISSTSTNVPTSAAVASLVNSISSSGGSGGGGGIGDGSNGYLVTVHINGFDIPNFYEMEKIRGDSMLESWIYGSKWFQIGDSTTTVYFPPNYYEGTEYASVFHAKLYCSDFEIFGGITGTILVSQTTKGIECRLAGPLTLNVSANINDEKYQPYFAMYEGRIPLEFEWLSPYHSYILPL